MMKKAMSPSGGHVAAVHVEMDELALSSMGSDEVEEAAPSSTGELEKATSLFVGLREME